MSDRPYISLINGLIIMTPSSYQNLSFPGLTGESRKALDARFRPAGMTGNQQRRFMKGPFNYATLNILREHGSIIPEKKDR